MPTETKQAVEWAYTQSYTDPLTKQTSNITKDMPMQLVDAVRSYFNSNHIAYTSFRYSDLQPYL